MAPAHSTGRVARAGLVLDWSLPGGHDAAANQRFREATPLGSWQVPEEIVGAVVYLASPASKFATGSVLVVDGGYTAR